MSSSPATHATNEALAPVSSDRRVFQWHDHASLWFSLGVGGLASLREDDLGPAKVKRCRHSGSEGVFSALCRCQRRTPLALHHRVVRARFYGYKTRRRNCASAGAMREAFVTPLFVGLLLWVRP